MPPAELPLLPGSRLGPAVDAMFRPMCQAVPSTEAETLAQAVAEHVSLVRDARRHNEFLDVAAAEQVAGILGDLLSRYSTFPTEQQALITGAARYFIRSDDAESDMRSVLGFDDDFEVVNLVLDVLGLPSLTLES